MFPDQERQRQAEMWVQRKLAAVAPLLLEAFHAGAESAYAPEKLIPEQQSSTSNPPRPEDPYYDGPNPAKILSEILVDQLPATWRKVYHMYGPWACRKAALIVTRAIYANEMFDHTVLRKINGLPVKDDEAPLCGSCGAAIDPASNADLDWTPHIVEEPTTQTGEFVERVSDPVGVINEMHNLRDTPITENDLFAPSVVLLNEEEEALLRIAEEHQEWSSNGAFEQSPGEASAVRERGEGEQETPGEIPQGTSPETEAFGATPESNGSSDEPESNYSGDSSTASDDQEESGVVSGVGARGNTQSTGRRTSPAPRTKAKNRRR